MMDKNMVNKTYDESNNDDNESFELFTINTQPLASKPKRLLRTRQWRNNLIHSVKQRRNILNTALFGRHESLIRLYHHRPYLRSPEKKRAKYKERVTINVSGNRYETYLSTLDAYPLTLLGNREKRKYYWSNRTNEYYFDRHRACFEAILYYYQSSGRLRRPSYVPLDTFIEEVLFFDLGPDAIAQIKELENVSIIKYIDLPNCFWRRYIWYYFEYPQNSMLARIIFFASMFFTVSSCVALAVETLPEYKDKYAIHLCRNPNRNGSSSLDHVSICPALFSSPFVIIQTICVSFFTIEFLLRLISTPSYFRFLLSIMNWIDLGAVVPYFVILGLILAGKESHFNKNTLIILRVLRILRFLRVFKLYLVVKQFKSLRVLSSTLKESFVEFIIMIVTLTLMAFLFGSALYFAEQDANGQVFDSIPKSTYWGVVTITAVGYGDMYPVTIAGRILTCICAFFGLATSGILVSVLVERYQRIYNRKQFLPEQIISAIDSSDSEHDEKQDFIERKFSAPRKNSPGELVLPPTATPPEISPKSDRKSPQHSTTSSRVRFIITITEEETNNNSMYDTANELMTQLAETIQNTGEKMNLKLISANAEAPDDESATTNQLPAIVEE